MLLARSATSSHAASVLLLFGGALVAAAILRFPLPAALVMVAMTDSILSSTFLARQVGPVTVRPYELALLCLLALAWLRPVQRSWGGSIGAALAAFLALVAISAGLAVAEGRTELGDAFNWARPLALLAVFWVVVRLFPTAEHRRFLLQGTAAIAAFTGVVALFAALGAGFTDSLREAGEQTIREEEPGVNRVRLPGLAAAYALFWYSAVQTLTRVGRQRLVWAALLAGIALNIAVSFNRNMWVGLVIGMALIVAFGGPLVRRRIALAAALACAAVFAIVVFGGDASNDRVVSPVVKRGETILRPGKTAEESSLQDRAKETRTAWATAKENPLLGVGAGASFGVLSRKPVISGSIYLGERTEPQLFLHNQYLYLLLIAGVPGLIAFLWFLGASVYLALRRRPQDLAILACGTGVALIMISSVVAIYFTVENMTTMLGLLCGVIVADRLGAAASGEPSGLLPE